MKKIFLFAMIIAGAATSFGQNAAAPKKNLTKQTGVKSYREAQAEKVKQEPVKTAPVDAKANATTSAPAKTK